MSDDKDFAEPLPDSFTGVAEGIDSLIWDYIRAEVPGLINDAETTNAFFPCLYYPKDGSKEKKDAPSDPLTLRFQATQELGAQTEWCRDFSITELLEDDLRLAKDGSYIEGISRMADALRRLIVIADEAIAAGSGKIGCVLHELAD